MKFICHFPYVASVLIQQSKQTATGGDEEVRFLSLHFKLAAADAFFSHWKIDDSIICSTQQ